MEGVVKYRHNVMDIHSIDAFLGVRGGYNNNLRDVYFVRALGECQNYKEFIYAAERSAGNGSNVNKVNYLRIKQLPRLMNPEDITCYAAIYDEWKKSGKLVLHVIKMSETMAKVVSAAILKIHDTYKADKAVTESMIRNFAAKALFWLDTVVYECMEGWSEKSVIKIVAENVAKEQEYLFYYFLTNIGCDVMLLENKADIDISDRLKKLSCAFELGAYGTSILDKYEKKVIIEPKDKPSKCLGDEHINVQANENKIRVTIPEHRKKKSQSAGMNDSAMARRTIMNSGQSLQAGNFAKHEKTFEELAQLASSIVMITVHERDREVCCTGSGIMIGEGGYILTNCHVVTGGRFFSVRLEDDEEIYYTDEVIKYNSVLDLAVIRIQRRLKPLSIYRGPQKLARGQRVVAIGSPLGLFNSVSDGIISGFRTIRDVDMIQFTAPISHGSSGGAVLNMFGEIIGISTAGIDDGQNINLAVGYENIIMFTKGFTT